MFVLYETTDPNGYCFFKCYIVSQLSRSLCPKIRNCHLASHSGEITHCWNKFGLGNSVEHNTL